MKQQLTTIVPQAYADGMRLVIGAMFFVTLAAFAFVSLIPRIEAEEAELPLPM